MRQAFDSLFNPNIATQVRDRRPSTQQPPHDHGRRDHDPSGKPDNWRDLANCRGRMELFFAKRAERPEARARREAKALTLCGQCQVATECREFARQHHEYGFWAGESEEDRHMLGFTVSAPIGTRARRHDQIRHTGTAG